EKGAIEITPGFCLLLAWFAAANGWKPLLLVLSAAAVHEAGHLLALRLLGGTVRGLRVSVQGAALDIDSACLTYGRELLCLLAGPAANFLLAAASASGLLKTRLDALTGASLLLGLYNLAPVRPLDGGRAVELAASWFLGPRAGENAARLCGVLCGILLAVGMAGIMVLNGGSLWLLPPMCGFFASALRELRGQAG
ncbi:MAG: hypothetical protein IJT94_07585, partial [Oscillibacter sp.]|nr:hypothetical protein [Oscillibacter sp.]